MTSYFEFLENLVSLHLKFLENAEHSSRQILKLAQANLLNDLTEETANRERVFNVVAQVQDKIDRSLKTLKVDEINSNYKDLIQNWKTQFDAIVSRINEIDQEILTVLIATKNQTTQEIATVHSNIEKFKGYNLSNLKP